MGRSFDIPLNLPHAGRVAQRIIEQIPPHAEDNAPLMSACGELAALLAPVYLAGENPPPSEAEALCVRAAAIGRRVVDRIEEANAGHDRLGQCVRNLFECLELGEEGAAISLRAGENPNSLARP